MKRTLKAALAATLALVMALTAIPASALPRFDAKAEVTPSWTVPEGYNVHDYTKCVEFLEQTDEDGVKNGTKLDSSYDPNDPGTWDGDYCFEWTLVNGEQRISGIFIFSRGLFGCLDISGCTALEVLDCSYNNISELDVTGCTALSRLYCSGNNLTELDVTGCTMLGDLSCYDNDLTELTVSGCTALSTLSCYYNDLTELDVTGCTALSTLDCYGNDLTELDITGCTALSRLDCYGNDLTELDITGCTALSRLVCGGNNLTELNVSGCTALRNLYCNDNDLTELNVSGCTALFWLECHNNNLTELNISGCTALEVLSCYSCNLTELNICDQQALPYDYVESEGNGFIGYSGASLYGYYLQYEIYAHPVHGASFEGFYDESGELISEGSWNDSSKSYIYEFLWDAISDLPTGTVIARFSGGFIPGDVDGNGSVSMVDAVTALRIAMGLLDGSGLNADAADMDGNGSITIADATVILRMAMGLA